MPITNRKYISGYCPECHLLGHYNEAAMWIECPGCLRQVTMEHIFCMFLGATDKYRRN